MSNLTQEQQISALLADEEKRYQDWYITLTQPNVDPEMLQFGVPDSLNKLKQRFQDWFESSRDRVKQILCQRYQREKKQFQRVEFIIAALSVDGVAIALSLPTTNLIMTTTILVADGYLDKLCLEC